MLGTRAMLLIAPFIFALLPVAGADSAVLPGASRSAADKFHIGRDARARLREMWSTSSQAKQERVACLGGSVIDGVAYISRIRQIEAPTRDSTHILAEESLRSCRPPEWLGTVHTHVATFGGQPFTTFSPDDRSVNWLWHKQWKEVGVFCVIYSERAAHCEWGEQLSGDPEYADDADDGVPAQDQDATRLSAIEE